MQLELVSLTGLKYSGEAYEVVIPTADGEIAVYPDHMPLISLAVPGVLTVRKKKDDADTELQTYATLGGVVEISGDHLRILVDEIEHEDELYEDEVREAYEKAQKMKSEATSAVDIEKAQALMDRHAIRLKVAELKRHHQKRR
jgi:F-type H+-transporting ATPase subunit epsilon